MKILLNFEDKYQGFKRISCMTDHKNSQCSNSRIFRTTDPILLKLVSFCSELINFHQNLWLVVTFF